MMSKKLITSVTLFVIAIVSLVVMNVNSDYVSSRQNVVSQPPGSQITGAAVNPFSLSFTNNLPACLNVNYKSTGFISSITAITDGKQIPFLRCFKYHDKIIEAIGKEVRLDPLIIYSHMIQKSQCKSCKELKAEGNPFHLGGLFRDLEYIRENTECEDPDDEIETFVKKLKKNLEDVYKGIGLEGRILLDFAIYQTEDELPSDVKRLLEGDKSPRGIIRNFCEQKYSEVGQLMKFDEFKSKLRSYQSAEEDAVFDEFLNKNAVQYYCDSRGVGLNSPGITMNIFDDLCGKMEGSLINYLNDDLSVYYTDTSFEVEKDYNFDVYAEISKGIEEKLLQCTSDVGEKKRECFENKIEELNKVEVGRSPEQIFAESKEEFVGPVQLYTENPLTWSFLNLNPYDEILFYIKDRIEACHGSQNRGCFCEIDLSLTESLHERLKEKDRKAAEKGLELIGIDLDIDLNMDFQTMDENFITSSLRYADDENLNLFEYFENFAPRVIKYDAERRQYKIVNYDKLDLELDIDGDFDEQDKNNYAIEANLEGGASVKIAGDKKIYLYKSNGNLISFVPNEFVEKDGVPVLFGQKSCLAPDPEFDFFKVTDTTKKLSVYDDSEGVARNRNLVYKFGIFTGDETPPQNVVGFNAVPSKWDDDVIYMQWSPPPDKDVAGYQLYTSSAESKGNALEFRRGQGRETYHPTVLGYYQFDQPFKGSFWDSIITVPGIGKVIKYTKDGKSVYQKIANGILYQTKGVSIGKGADANSQPSPKSQGTTGITYHLFYPNAPAGNNWFGIAAVDKSQNIHKLTKDEVINVKSERKLPPGIAELNFFADTGVGSKITWETPKKEIDGTNLKPGADKKPQKIQYRLSCVFAAKEDDLEAARNKFIKDQEGEKRITYLSGLLDKPGILYNTIKPLCAGNDGKAFVSVESIDPEKNSFNNADLMNLLLLNFDENANWIGTELRRYSADLIKTHLGTDKILPEFEEAPSLIIESAEFDPNKLIVRKLEDITIIEDNSYSYPITARVNDEVKGKSVHALILLHGIGSKDKEKYMFSDRINIVDYFDEQIKNDNIEPTIIITLDDLRYSGSRVYAGLDGESVVERIELILKEKLKDIVIRDFSVLAYSGSSYLTRDGPTIGLPSFIKSNKDLKFIALADSEISDAMGKYYAEELKESSIKIYSISRGVNTKWDVNPQTFALNFGAKNINIKDCDPASKNIERCYATEDKKVISFKSKNPTHHQMPRELLEEVFKKEISTTGSKVS